MKTECKIPELYLFDSSNRSTSGSSSQSWHSSVSGFKDETLAKFEEELIFASRPKSRGSLKRKRSGKSSKHFKSKSSEKLFSESKVGTGSVYLQQIRSAESETSGISCYSLSSSTRSPPLEELSNFAEQLSCDIISDCFSAMFSGAKTTCGITRKIQRKNHVSSYADRIAAEILQEVMLKLQDKPQWLPWEPISEIKMDDESQSQSDEFADALDIPYKRLEEYADILSLNVLQRSINVFRREKESTKRVSNLFLDIQ